MSFTGPGNYREEAAKTIRDKPEVRTSITAATRTFDAHRVHAWGQIDADRWRDWARDVKSHVLGHLDEYLEQAEEQLTANGAHVHWAETAEDAPAEAVETPATRKEAPPKAEEVLFEPEPETEAQPEPVTAKAEPEGLGEESGDIEMLGDGFWDIYTTTSICY